MEKKKKFPSQSQGGSCICLAAYHKLIGSQLCARHHAGHGHSGVEKANGFLPLWSNGEESPEIQCLGTWGCLGQGIPGNERPKKDILSLPLTAPDHLWFDFLVFFRSCTSSQES